MNFIEDDLYCLVQTVAGRTLLYLTIYVVRSSNDNHLGVFLRRPSSRSKIGGTSCEKAIV